MQEASEDPLADIKTLREYLEQNKPKIAKDQPTNLSRSAAANHNRVKSEPKEAGVQGSSQLKQTAAQTHGKQPSNANL
jgi:hypothetical protein